MGERYHFVGIGGIGMSALAKICLEKGDRVSGSDLKKSAITQRLQDLGANVFYCHDPKNVPEDAIAVVSSSVSKKNGEAEAAKTIWHRSDLLHHLLQQKNGIAVFGTHGKTTTSSLLAWTLDVSGGNPGFAVGGILQNFHTNGRWTEGDFFVAEGDESDGTFTAYEPNGAIVTGIGLDHMDYYGSENKLLQAFQQVCNKPKILVWNGDDPRLCTLNLSGISYGESPGCSIRLLSAEQSGWSQKLTFTFEGKLFENVVLSLSGKHNASNGLAVFAMALSLGFDEEKIRNAFASFAGVRRRCQQRGELGGASFWDDYAHHPTEIETTLNGIRLAEPLRRLVALFQPHRYSRTKWCLQDFSRAFRSADVVIVTDVYSAGEQVVQGLGPKEILSQIQMGADQPTLYLPREDLAKKLPFCLKPNDLLVTLGAGDITCLHEEIFGDPEK